MVSPFKEERRWAMAPIPELKTVVTMPALPHRHALWADSSIERAQAICEARTDLASGAAPPSKLTPRCYFYSLLPLYGLPCISAQANIMMRQNKLRIVLTFSAAMDSLMQGLSGEVHILWVRLWDEQLSLGMVCFTCPGETYLLGFTGIDSPA